MNLGGTEKSFLNLLKQLPTDCRVTLLLLEKNGALLCEIPAHVEVLTLKNSDRINEMIRLGNRRFALAELIRGNYVSALLNVINFILLKLKLTSNPFYGITHYLEDDTTAYDYTVAYAGIHDFIAYYALRYTRARKKYLWIHFDVTKVVHNKDFGRKFYSAFDKILVVSRTALSEFTKMFPKTVKSAEAFENTVSVAEVQKLAHEHKGFSDDYSGLRIITLGRLSWEKGQNMIPYIVKKMKDEGLTFKWYLIGDGNLREEITKDIQKLGIQSHLVILGSQLNPYPYIKQCDLMVLTSVYEGYPVAIVEAKAFNKPVVTTNFLSADDLIVNEEDGLITTPTVEGIYSAVKKILENPELIDKFSRTLLINKVSPNKILDLFD